MKVKEGILEEINLHCEAISREVTDGMPSAERYGRVIRQLESISAKAGELSLYKEEPPVRENAVQFAVLFKNKALMGVRTDRESAIDTYNEWAKYKAGGEKDSVCSIGEEGGELMVFSFSDVCCIKLILSQKDVAL